MVVVIHKCSNRKRIIAIYVNDFNWAKWYLLDSELVV